MDGEREDSPATDAWRNKLWDQLRDVFWLEQIHSVEFTGDFLIIECRLIPPEATRPFIIDNRIVIWKGPRQSFGTSLGLAGQGRLTPSMVTPVMGARCRPRQIPPDDVILQLATSQFRECIALSLMGNSLVVELCGLEARDHRRRLATLPVTLHNLPFDISYHNGYLPNTPESLGLGEASKVESAYDTQSTNLFLNSPFHEKKRFVCKWNHSVREPITPWEPPDDVGAAYSHHANNGHSQIQNPRMIPLSALNVGERFTMRSCARGNKRVVYYGLRVTFGWVVDPPDGSHIKIKRRNCIFFPEIVLDRRPLYPRRPDTCGPAVAFVRDDEPGQPRRPVMSSAEIGAFMRSDHLEMMQDFPCVLNSLLHAEPCDWMMANGLYMILATH